MTAHAVTALIDAARPASSYYLPNPSKELMAEKINVGPIFLIEVSLPYFSLRIYLAAAPLSS
jgi:hypothetical protein